MGYSVDIVGVGVESVDQKRCPLCKSLMGKIPVRKGDKYVGENWFCTKCEYEEG